ncbi:MAG: phosphate ABC transporter ATP-binding protein PstB [Candidatus Methanomethyliaceae archaeon]|nr:phosphate ABC transporter ATP-binding protein PstB [Candidatus Methanomethyliaceae archaeon]
MSSNKLKVEDLSAWFYEKQVLNRVSLEFPDKKVIAIIGPSGCGKTTFIRCLNRMHELTPGARVRGRVVLDGKDIYTEMDAMEVRRKIGMVFQKPNPFPNMSIYDNVVAGLKLMGIRDKALLDKVVESKLREVGLWDEVSDDLRRSGAQLSGGQQQRLCIARALATEPEVLLMDEPTSSLDPSSTAKIESLVRVLKNHATVIIITHNVQQAARVSDYTAFLYLGDLIEFGETKKIFESPKNPLTEKYVTGRFG